MITVKLTEEEIKYIMEKIKHCEKRELYSKFWRLLFNKGEKT
jgi:hypothetical protein